tara:strand:+ start:3136 stop:5124 length:1989 start_codon:yes stop_codon:yes gene_type:complete
MATRISRTDRVSFHLASGNDGDIAEDYKTLQTLFQNHNIAKSIALFAKPVNATDGGIEWYTDYADQPVSLVDLPEDKQEQLKKIIMDKGKAILHVAQRLPQDEPDRKIIENALLFPEERNVFSMNGQPVITAWGFKKEGLAPLNITDFSPRSAIPPPDLLEEEKKPKRGLWWLWLLLLLLLLLAALFLWFKPCRYIPFAIPHVCPMELAEVDFDFPDTPDAKADTIITSEIIKITDIPDNTPVSMTGFKDPQYRICTDGSSPKNCDNSVRKDWRAEPDTINNGEYIQTRLQSSAKEEETHRAYLTIGKSTDQWDVTTEKLLHGICGEAHEQAYEVQEDLEAAGLCTSDEPASSVFETENGWTWTCPPTSENGDKASCDASQKEIKHGECGNAHEQSYEIIDEINKSQLCASEEPATDILDTGTNWAWTCPPTSKKNGKIAECLANKKQIKNGECGNAHNSFFETEEELKKAELCTQNKDAEQFTANEKNWTWSCPSPSENGQATQCMAQLKEKPPEPEEPKENTSEFDRRVKNAGGKRGEVQVTLLWNNINDLDVHVYCPNKTHIWYKGKQGCRGVLDIDANAMPGLFQRYIPPTNTPVENVTWVNGAPNGTYQVYVKHYQHRGGSEPTPYQVLVRVKDKEKVYKGTVKPGQSKFIASFNVP